MAEVPAALSKPHDRDAQCQPSWLDRMLRGRLAVSAANPLLTSPGGNTLCPNRNDFPVAIGGRHV